MNFKAVTPFLKHSSAYVTGFLLMLEIVIIPASPDLLAQAKWRLPITVTDSSNGVVATGTGYFGVHPNATNCVDSDTMRGFTDHWSDIFVFGQPYGPDCIEYDAPPASCCLSCRIKSLTPPACNDIYELNIQKFTSSSQIDTFTVVALGLASDSVKTLLYEVPSVVGEYCESLIIAGSVTDVDQYGNIKVGEIRVDLVKTHRYLAHQTGTHDILKSFTLFLYHPKVGPPIPEPVNLTFPAVGDTIQILQPTLGWDSVPQARSYRFELALDPGFSAIVEDAIIALTSHQTIGLQPLTTYYWRVSVTTPYGISYYQNPPGHFTTGGADAADGLARGVLNEFRLFQNFPNPSNPSTWIEYILPRQEHLRLSVYNLLGEEVKRLVDGVETPGHKIVPFDASRLASGIYFYQLTAGPYKASGKMAVLR